MNSTYASWSLATSRHISDTDLDRSVLVNRNLESLEQNNAKASHLANYQHPFLLQISEYPKVTMDSAEVPFTVYHLPCGELIN